MEKNFVEVTLNENAIAMKCNDGCQRASGAQTGG